MWGGTAETGVFSGGAPEDLSSLKEVPGKREHIWVQKTNYSHNGDDKKKRMIAKKGKKGKKKTMVVKKQEGSK